MTEEQRRKNMQHIRSKDTSIEVQLRKALWEKGIRYRKNDKKIPGKPDIVISKYRIAVFCDGEFFHGRDWDSLRIRLEKGKNSEFWINKILKNKKRDEEMNQKLRYLGWTVLRFWEKDIKKHTDECVRAVEEAIFDCVLNEQK